jgi:hypothetical protein
MRRSAWRGVNRGNDKPKRSRSKRAPETDIREIQDVGEAIVSAAAQRRATEAEREDLLRREHDARTEAEAANQTGAKITDDIAEHVFRYERRVILGILKHPHTNGVDVYFVGPNVRVTLCHIAEAVCH